MERIGVRELRQNASRYLALVKAGETVEVTERGRLIALLQPPDDAHSRRDELIAQGRIAPGSGRLTFPPRVVSDESTSALLDDLRGD